MSHINLAVCLGCGAVLNSTHRHDYVECDCANHSAVDGGTDYRRRCGVDLSKIRDCSTVAEAAELSGRVLREKHASK